MHPTEHPSPLFRRPVELLDGTWRFSFDGRDFDREIRVPYAPETPASGVGEPWVDHCWYRTSLPCEAPNGGDRVIVHFGAVDRHARVHAGGTLVAEHEGGYVPFSADVTDHIAGDRLELVVQADDDPTDLGVPRGKQDWLPEPHDIWYPRTTGIWRSVWIERVPATHIAELSLRGSARTMTVDLAARVEGPLPSDSRLAVRVTGPRGRILVDDTIAITGRDVSRSFRIGDGGLDDRDDLVWWPRRPVLLSAEVAIVDGAAREVDRVESYTALRDVEVADGRILLNRRPYPLRLVLDQGYWPDTGMTPPDVAALRRDIELTKALGFNGVRKHQKVEDPRYLALADHLGLLVWVEMPSAYTFGPRQASALVKEWTDIVRAANGHPSVIAWVPINESWGVPQLTSSPEQRALVRGLAGIASSVGGGRPVSANDGWETTGGDIVGVHDYDQRADVLRDRYTTADAIDGLLTGRRADGLLADLDRRPAEGRAVVLSEFGGIALRVGETAEGSWGYREVGTADEFLTSYADLWRAVHDSAALAGACWTQLTDCYQEINGLLTMDRTPKIDPDTLARATRGRA